MDNRRLAWYQVLGALLVSCGLLFYVKISNLFAIEPRWAGLVAMASGAVLLGIPDGRAVPGDLISPQDKDVGADEGAAESGGGAEDV